jgi:Redoxin
MWRLLVAIIILSHVWKMSIGSFLSFLLLSTSCVVNGFVVQTYPARNYASTALKATEVELDVMPEVSVGFKIPEVTMMEGLVDFGRQEVNIAEMVAGKKVVIFGVPGAFTPGCSKSHLPSFIDAQEDLKAKGVDMTICMATNDPFVMEVRNINQKWCCVK